MSNISTQGITPNFKHRLTENSDDNFMMTLFIMTDRAIAITNLLTTHVSPHEITTQNALNALEQELLDIQAYLRAASEQ